MRQGDARIGRIRRSGLAAVSLGGVLALGAAACTTPAPTPARGSLNQQFNGSSLDSSAWQYFPALGCTRDRNATVSGGYLHVKTSLNYCGVRLGTRQTFQYGTVSARMKFDLAQGSHTGISLYGTKGRWPSNGEIDVAEEVGRFPYKTHLRVWSQLEVASKPRRCGTSGNIPTTVNGAWHTYGVDWEPGSITFTLDGRVVWWWTAKQAAAHGCTYPFDDPGYRARLYFTSSVGGLFAGKPPADHAGYPLDTLVDRVMIF